jgi:hypothetical protein
VVDALKKDALKKHPGLKNKQLQALVEKIDPNQTLSIATTGEFFAKLNFLDKNTKALLANCDAVSGGITVADDVKLEIGLTAKTAADAKDLSKLVNDSLNAGLGVLALLSVNEPKLAPLVDFIKSVKSTAKDKTVIIKGQISAEAIDKALDKKDF